MIKISTNLTLIASVIYFSSLYLSHCYLYHRRLLNCHHTCLRNSSEVPKKIVPVDEEILKRLTERHKDEIYRYLDPLGSQQVEQVSEKELEETFGKPLTKKNLAEREKQVRRIDPYNLPDVGPTDKLPYFVNLEFVPESHTNVEAYEQDVDSNVDHEPDAVDTNTNISQDALENNQNNEPVLTESIGGLNRKDGPDTKVIDSEPNTIISGVPIDYNSKDPLKPFFDRMERHPDPGIEYGPKWYLPDKKSQLTPVEYEDGWSILPCGKIYKHILQPSLLDGKDKEPPTDISSVTFKFKIMEAKKNTKIIETDDAGAPMVTTYMKELSPVMQKCLKAMNTGEQAEFIFHLSQLNPDNIICEQFAGVTWVRMWINLWESHDPNSRWWGLGPDDAHLYPSKRETGMSTREALEKKTDEITKQIESEMCANPASPLWEDVLEKMSTSEKESYVKHFDKQLERVERMKYSEFTGSRAFGEKIKTTGQVGGYDVGHQMGGVSKFITWRETPFMMYVAVSVIEGVRAEHVKLDLTSRHLVLSIGNSTIIDDDLTGSVDLDTTGVWAMSDAALQHVPLDSLDPRLNQPTIDLGRNDDYDKVSKRPSVLIFLKKIGTSVSIWGSPFVNT
ncbi:hypothetical protein MACJ_001021 [Theileria orientalis]|uniref:CS domain-containing protein n=1 Tax=Theileria orientalis TaxID=68886 RepID=A0A976QT28_THEOR|nr:hypothetical protein MACJ_001021 [Theileria orientalis]